MYLSSETIESAVQKLVGTAEHMLKIWLTLKEMGLTESSPVTIDTSNSTDALNRLFGIGDTKRFFVPFSHTSRFAFMKTDASRSIIQTTIVRWAESGSVVTVDPSEYLDFNYLQDSSTVAVSCGRMYPQGLGYGKNGFARADGSRVSIPITAFAVWLFRFDDISFAVNDDGDVDQQSLVQAMEQELRISPAEREAIFVEDVLDIQTSPHCIPTEDLIAVCETAHSGKSAGIEIVSESTKDYMERIQMTTTISPLPAWLKQDPETTLASLVEQGERAILLYGPHRTGKTRGIDAICSRDSDRRVTIQLHEGWSYENLILGLSPVPNQPGMFEWKAGALLTALREGKKHIVLEEANRTRLSQALGEVFSLIESAYRGQQFAIQLPNGERFWIDEDVTFYFTLNDLDRSTEDVDDALFGRIASVEFVPRVESLSEILAANHIPNEISRPIRKFFAAVQDVYPLGHGYFADFRSDMSFQFYYATRIRPVLLNHFGSYDRSTVAQLDNQVDELF